MKNYILDLDGVVCEDVPNERPELMESAAEISGAREWINKRYESGDYICFFTARMEINRQVTENWLRIHGFNYHQIIFGKPRGGNYHYVDNLRIQATTFKGQFSEMVIENHPVEVFS